MKMSESSRDKDKKPYDNNNLTMWEDSSKQAILAMGNIGDGLGNMQDPIKLDAAGVALFGKH